MQTITIAGRIGRDAELRRTQGGEVAGFTVAVDTRKGREKVTNWWRCSMWGKRAEAVAPYLLKGSSVAITGEFTLDEYEGKPQLNCRVSELTLLGGKSDGQRSDNQQRQNSGGQGGGNSFPTDDLDDDSIPF